jgi:hypothetical protein
MAKSRPALPGPTEETLLASFGGIVGYHNDMTQARFTIAGLYLAATGFLAGSWLSDPSHQGSSILIPVVGLFFALVCLLLDFRTRHLLNNVSQKGRAIERLLRVQRGFFARMEMQPWPAQLPFMGPQLRHSLSYTLILNLLYALTALSWIVVLEWRGLELLIYGT